MSHFFTLTASGQASESLPRKLKEGELMNGIVNTDTPKISFEAMNMQPVSKTLNNRISIVCRITLLDNSNNITKDLGTGFLIGKGLLLTNNHVIPDKKTASKALVWFHYEKGNQKNAIQVHCNPDKNNGGLFITNESDKDSKIGKDNLDFTILALESKPEGL